MRSKTVFARASSRKALAVGGLIPLFAIGSAFLTAPALAQIVPLPGVPLPPVLPVIDPIVDPVVDPVVTPPVAPPVVPPVVVEPVVVAPVVPVTSGTINLTNSTTPIAVTLADGFVSNGPVDLGTVGGADIDLVSNGVSSIANTGSGLTATSGSGINANVTNITTAGDGAIGAALTAVDEAVFTSDGTIGTTGANSDALAIQGRTVTADLNAVRTDGPDSNGVQTFSTDGPTSVTFDTIDTNGDLSSGTVLRGTGDTNLTGRAITTGGTDAAAFDISNDAATCILLGAGGCDNTVTVDNVTTNGFGGIGGLATATGDTNVNVGVLRTGGDEAAGLNLSNNPNACLVLGAGGCDTAFTVGDLATAGDRSPGAIVRGSGDTTADVGVLRTGGDQAAGLDLASDPQTCAVLGAGACDTSFSVGQLTTDGAGSTGALIRSSGDTNGRIGVLQTNGNDAAGIDIASDPTACVILGAGACDTALTADQVSTRGSGAAGVLIDTPGQIVTNLGLVSTQGDDSTGLGITQNPAACLAIGPGACGTRATAGTVTTGGDNSPAIDIMSPGPVALTATRVTTTGDNSDAIRVAGVNGPITISSGTVATTGVASNGIVANATACANIDITARDDVISAQGTAIVAQSQCTVTVTTLAGATVTGRTAGIDVTSGTGATIVIGDSLSSAAGPALNVDGASANVTITPTGSIIGRIDLTPANDRLTNNGLFVPVGTSDFGAGADVLTNNGTVRVNGNAQLGGLEQFANNGLIDMVDGVPDDRLTLAGDFAAGTGGTLAVDVNSTVAGTPADRLIVGGNVTGNTVLRVNRLGTGPAVANPTGVLVVDAAQGSTGTFALQGPLRSGLIDFSLRQAAGDTLLVAAPNELAIEPLLLGRVGQDFWYQSADAWSETAALRRHDLGTENAKSVSVWAQGYGSSDKRGDRSRSVDVFGTSRDTNLRIDTDRQGAQVGVDFRPGRSAFAVGVTGGYQHAESDFASGTRSDAAGYNVGAYALYGGAQGLYGELLAKADFFDVDLSNGTLFDGGDIDGKSYGAEGEIGVRTGLGSFNLDLGGGLAYVRTDLDGFQASGFAFDFDKAESLRGRLGVRIGSPGPGFLPYVDAKVLHEFMGGNDSSFASGGFTQVLADRAKGTWFRGEVGLTGSADRFGGFVSAFGEAGDVKGFGLRAGFRW